MRAGWAALNEAWAETIGWAQRLPAQDLLVSVDGEWSFVQTLRHLILAIDKWFAVPILGEPFHPFGLPNTGSLDVPWPGLDLDAAPSLADVLAVRGDRVRRLADYLADVRPTTSPGPSTCSRTARTRYATASPPSSRRSSGTTATRCATSPSWKRPVSAVTGNGCLSSLSQGRRSQGASPAGIALPSLAGRGTPRAASLASGTGKRCRLRH
jgi:hypothetical protein